ncbi:hypothetical protein FSC37_20950 [Piscinibacter aquaticus]|uniref:Uncharacterized protein n=1 Tax=Piscinibacter aquaticus TaxID=392597 RepID=A0A5C6U3P7_9BURK|nr:hypothetical protein FSC37_20950 [Piscinibacter aquaticus]
MRLVLGRSDIPEGEAAVEHGVKVAQDCGAPDITFYGLTNLWWPRRCRGTIWTRAEARLRLMQEAAAQRTGAPEQPTQQATMHVLAARWLTLRGDAATAMVRMERALEIARASEFPLSETWIYHLGHVQVLTALGREPEAVALAEERAGAYEGLRSDYLRALSWLARCAQAGAKGGRPSPPTSGLASSSQPGTAGSPSAISFTTGWRNWRPRHWGWGGARLRVADDPAAPLAGTEPRGGRLAVALAHPRTGELRCPGR